MRKITISYELKNKISLISIIVIFLFQFLMIFNANQETQNLCELDQLANNKIEKFGENYQEISYKNKEISIFPQVLNLSCLNLISAIETNENKATIIFYNSNNFYNIFNFFGNFLILIYFFNNKNIKYFFLTLSLFSYFNYLIFFHNELVLSIFFKYLFIYISCIFLYFLIGDKLDSVKFFDYFSVLIFLTLFSSYQAFSNLLFAYFLIFFISGDFQSKTNIEKYKNYIIFTPLIFLMFRLIGSFNGVFDHYWRVLSSDIFKSYKRFGDLQLTLNAIKCNFSELYTVPQYAKFDKNILSCPFETGYPLIDEYISFNIQNIWESTLAISFIGIILFALIYLKILNNNSSYKFFIFILFVSPPVTFLIERMNIDIFIFILTWFLISNKKINTYIKSGVVILTTTLKLFTFPIIFSLLFDSLKERNRRNTLIYGLASSVITIYTYYFFVIVGNFGYKSTYWDENFFSQTFSNPSISFGLLANYAYLEEKFLSFGIIIYGILWLFYSIMFLIYMKANFQKNIEENYKSINKLSEIILIPMLLLLLLYQNIDYRITFFILIFSIILKIKNKILTISYFLFLTTSGTNYLLGNDLIVFLNLSSQIIIFVYLIYFYLHLFTKKINKDT